MPPVIAGIPTWIIPIGIVAIYIVGAFGHRIWVLEKDLEKKMEITYDKGASYTQVLVRGGKKTGRLHRIKVRNKSKTKTIDDVSVCVKSVLNRDHAFPREPLEEIGGTAEFSLHGGGETFVNLFLAPDEVNSEFLVMYANKSLRSTLPRGIDGIEIEVRGRDVPSDSVWFRPHSTKGGKLILTRIFPDEPWRERWQEWVGVG